MFPGPSPRAATHNPSPATPGSAGSQSLPPATERALRGAYERLRGTRGRAGWSTVSKGRGEEDSDVQAGARRGKGRDDRFSGFGERGYEFFFGARAAEG